MIGRPRLRTQFGPTTFGGCRHWGSLEVVSLEELVGLTAQMILVSPMTEIVGIVGPELDLLARCGPVLG